MKSTLKIDLGSGNEPMITASVSTDATDLRDLVMNKFFNALSFYPPDSPEKTISSLCFIEGFGREREPESYIHTITPIRPGEEEKFINRLQGSQARRIIPLAFQMFNKEHRTDIIKLLQEIDKELTLKYQGEPKS